MDFTKNKAFEGFDALANDVVSVDQLTPQLIEFLDKQGFVGIHYQRFDGLQLSQGQLACANFRELRLKAHLWTAVAMVRLEALQLVLCEAQAQGISVLLLKGAALGYQIYESPGLRPGVDIDVYIDKKQIDQVVGLFTALGYDVDATHEESQICFQFCAVKMTDGGQAIVFDVHYQINNQAQYAALFDFQSLLSNSLEIPSISGSARGLSMAHAYVLACVHLQGHFSQGEQIKAVWLYDIHLLLQKMTRADQKLVLQFIEISQLGAVCARWTEVSLHWFEADMPDMVKDYFAGVAKQHKSSCLNGVNPVRQLWDQFYYLSSTRARFDFLKHLFFPASQRIRDKYPNSKLSIPILYGRRAISGLFKRLRKIRM
jgi:hypothetical protein